MDIFGPIWTQFSSKQLIIWPGSHFWSNRLNRIESTRSDRLDSIGSTRSDRLDSIGSTRLDRIDSTRSDRLDSIGSNWLQIWLPGWILRCLDLNWVQIGPKMAIFKLI
jgi:hypothetical protein